MAATIWLQHRPEIMEHWYARAIYPYIGRLLRVLLGWLPISVGDVLAGLLILVMLRYLVCGLRLLWLRKLGRKKVQASLKNILFYSLVAYISFHALWGFNYYRKGSVDLLQLQPTAYTTAEVHTLISVLNQRLMVLCQDTMSLNKGITNNRKQLSHDAVMAYQAASQQYAFMAFRHASLKPNLLGPLQSYTGYGGYLFPFTGEAQVDFYPPAFVLPFTVAHEMAHQQGFGSESEANLIGYLACKASNNAAFRYSAYTQLQAYALQELWLRDSIQATMYRNKLPERVVQDRKLLRAYYEARQSWTQPLLNWVYHIFLIQNNQPDGIMSYNRVVAWLIAYGKKYGWESI